MATAEQKAASKKIMDAVIALNAAIRNAHSEKLTVKLRTLPDGQYQVDTIEFRETVLP